MDKPQIGHAEAAYLPAISPNPPRQLPHHRPQFRRRIAADHFAIADARPAQGFLLDRVARGGGVLVVAGALEFDCVARAAIAVDDPQVNPRPIFLHSPASVILPR